MKSVFKFGWRQKGNSAPLWVQKVMGLCAVLLAAKGFIISGLPGISPEHMQLAGAWWDWAINFLNVGCAILMVLSGEELKFEEDEVESIKEDKPL